jgi:hypothetical protein
MVLGEVNEGLETELREEEKKRSDAEMRRLTEEVQANGGESTVGTR